MSNWPTIYYEERFTVRCDCGWTSYPFKEESAALSEWREHNRAQHPDGQGVSDADG